ncbi:hypothetical protein [Simiduia aestuariiviva]|uniref:Uncharacterized protein n=1 Tax=Simiduia aestuariiviva TaxID=1510459 RepID=A0A839UVU4_9GAMM|nr:hypothetical protein [Simiduia aestuariiviva]MBB3169455.1 hypothetical protein [Simiduia aestuariiviva]
MSQRLKCQLTSLASIAQQKTLGWTSLRSAAAKGVMRKRRILKMMAHKLLRSHDQSDIKLKRLKEVRL